MSVFKTVTNYVFWCSDYLGVVKHQQLLFKYWGFLIVKVRGRSCEGLFTLVSVVVNLHLQQLNLCPWTSQVRGSIVEISRARILKHGCIYGGEPNRMNKNVLVLWFSLSNSNLCLLFTVYQFTWLFVMIIFSIFI